MSRSSSSYRSAASSSSSGSSRDWRSVLEYRSGNTYDSLRARTKPRIARLARLGNVTSARRLRDIDDALVQAERHFAGRGLSRTGSSGSTASSVGSTGRSPARGVAHAAARQLSGQLSRTSSFGAPTSWSLPSNAPPAKRRSFAFWKK